MLRRNALLVSFFCCLWGTEAQAKDTRICNDVSVLQKANAQVQAEGQLADPGATRGVVTSLSQRLKRVRAYNLPEGVSSKSDALGKVSTSLDQAVARSDAEALFLANLLSLRTDLELLTVIFGCDFIASTGGGSDTKPLAIRHVPSAGQEEKGGIGTVRDPIVLGGGSLGLLAVIAAILARLGLRGRAKREVCNTPVLVSIDKGCTKTRIVDINRNGMKIEAAPIHLQDDCVDIYFCGHRRRGKIRWKNEYFAGILFQKRLPQAAVADVVEKSQTLMENSGIEKNSPACYGTGCDKECAKYCPSAMSVRAANDHE
jgi:hypothetical protein